MKNHLEYIFIEKRSRFPNWVFIQRHFFFMVLCSCIYYLCRQLILLTTINMSISHLRVFQFWNSIKVYMFCYIIVLEQRQRIHVHLPIPDQISFLHWYHQRFQRSVMMCWPPVDIVVECMAKCNEVAVDNSCIVDCPIFGRKCMQQPYQLRL